MFDLAPLVRATFSKPVATADHSRALRDLGRRRRQRRRRRRPRWRPTRAAAPTGKSSSSFDRLQSSCYRRSRSKHIFCGVRIDQKLIVNFRNFAHFGKIPRATPKVLRATSTAHPLKTWVIFLESPLIQDGTLIQFPGTRKHVTLALQRKRTLLESKKKSWRIFQSCPFNTATKPQLWILNLVIKPHFANFCSQISFGAKFAEQTRLSLLSLNGKP